VLVVNAPCGRPLQSVHCFYRLSSLDVSGIPITSIQAHIPRSLAATLHYRKRKRRPELPPRYNATETQGYGRHDGLEDGSLGDRRLCRGPLEFSIALSGSLKRAVQTPGGRPGSARAPSFGNQPARGVRYGGLRSGSVKRVAAAVGEGAQVVPELNDAQMKVLLMALEFETSGVSTTTTRTRV
jgi:hypothetical protein